MEIKTLKSLALGSCLAFAIVACQENETGDNNFRDTANIGNENRSDNRSLDREEDFVSDVLEANAEELDWLREGVNKATDPQVKSMAQEMITEHEKMNDDIRNYASKQNFRLDDIDTVKTATLKEDRGTEWDE